MLAFTGLMTLLQLAEHGHMLVKVAGMAFLTGSRCGAAVASVPSAWMYGE